MPIDNIKVRVSLCNKDSELAAAECLIPVTPNTPVRVQDLVDACQRSVARCIDALEKDLDKRQ